MADYTSLSGRELDVLLSRYQLGEVTKVKRMAGGQANSSVKIVTDTGSYILSLCDEKNSEEVARLTALLAHLEQHSFPTSHLVRTRDGAFQTGHGDTPVYMKKFIPGSVVPSLSPTMLFQVGETMAALHRVPPLAGMVSCFPYGLGSFDELLLGESLHPHPDFVDYTDWLREKKNFLEAAIDPGMNRVLIHGDIFWDNLLFAGDNLVALLDFEEACIYYNLYDLGMCAVGCCAVDGTLDLEKLSSLLAGYQKHIPLWAEEQTQLRLFMEYAAVAASFWRFRQYNIRRPAPEKKESYRELSTLADQIHTMTDQDILAICSGNSIPDVTGSDTVAF